MDHIITIPLPGPLQRHLLILHYSSTLLRPFIDRAQVEEIGRVLLQYHEQIPVPHIPPAQVDDSLLVVNSSDSKGTKGIKGRRSTRATSTTTTTTTTAASTAITKAAEEEGPYTYSDDTTSHPIAIPPMTLLSLLSFTDTTTTASNNNSNNTSSNDTSNSGVWAASYCINRLIATSEGWSSREIIKLIHNIQVRVLSMSSDRYVVYTPYFCPYFRLNFVLSS